VCIAYGVNMQDRPRENDAPQESTEHDPLAEFLEQWLKIREAQGHTKEAASSELTQAGAALLAALKRAASA
jgi:hypothetical protein